MNKYQPTDFFKDLDDILKTIKLNSYELYKHAFAFQKELLLTKLKQINPSPKNYIGEVLLLIFKDKEFEYTLNLLDRFLTYLNDEIYNSDPSLDIDILSNRIDFIEKMTMLINMIQDMEGEMKKNYYAIILQTQNRMSEVLIHKMHENCEDLLNLKDPQKGSEIIQNIASIAKISLHALSHLKQFLTFHNINGFNHRIDLAFAEQANSDDWVQIAYEINPYLKGTDTDNEQKDLSSIIFNSSNTKSFKKIAKIIYDFLSQEKLIENISLTLFEDILNGKSTDKINIIHTSATAIVRGLLLILLDFNIIKENQVNRRASNAFLSNGKLIDPNQLRKSINRDRLFAEKSRNPIKGLNKILLKEGYKKIKNR